MKNKEKRIKELLSLARICSEKGMNPKMKAMASYYRVQAELIKLLF